MLEYPLPTYAYNPFILGFDSAPEPVQPDPDPVGDPWVPSVDSTMRYLWEAETATYGSGQVSWTDSISGETLRKDSVGSVSMGDQNAPRLNRSNLEHDAPTNINTSIRASIFIVSLSSGYRLDNQEDTPVAGLFGTRNNTQKVNEFTHWGLDPTLSYDISVDGFTNTEGNARINGGDFGVSGENIALDYYTPPAWPYPNGESDFGINMVYTQYESRSVALYALGALRVGSLGLWVVSGTFYDAGFWTVTPSLDEIHQAEGYLAHKRGIQSKLPLDHPYRNSPPTLPVP